MITERLSLALLALAAGVADANAQAHTSSALAGAALIPAERSGAPAPVGVAPRIAAEGASSPAPSASSPKAEGNVASLSSVEAAALVSSQQGRPTVVILYGTGCPRSEAMFPGFAALATRHAARNVAFLAFATDRVAEDVPGFLARADAPFEPVHINRSGTAHVAGAMATIGLQLPDPWNMPHVAVLDASGRVVGEWDGATDLRAIDAALRSLP